MSPEEQIRQGKIVATFVNDDVIRGVFSAYEQRIVNRWRQAPTLELRELAHAELRAFEGFRKELRTVVDRGLQADPAR